MGRKHLFAIVVLLGAAAIAGLLALTRTTTAATQASSTQIAAKTRSLDRLEASLRRSLSEQSPALAASAQRADQAFPADTVYIRSSAQTPIGEDEHDDDDHDGEHEQEEEHEGADD